MKKFNIPNYARFKNDLNEINLDLYNDRDKVIVEFFIVKRRVPKDAQYASMQRRVQEFRPNAGPRKTKQVLESMNNFLTNVLDSNGKFIEKDHECKSPLGKCDNCMQFSGL